MWLLLPSAPVTVLSKVVWALLSPQSTSTCQGASLAPGSSKEPRSKLALAPSSELWSAAAVMIGATLATATICTDSDAVVLAPSESSTFILTLAVEGPSGKWQSNLPPVVVGE